MWRKLNNKLNIKTFNKLDHVTIQDPDTLNRKTLHNHDEISNALLHENSKIMKDGHGSFPTTPEFYQNFGHCGEKTGTKQLLQYGEFPPSLPSNKYEEQLLTNGMYKINDEINEVNSTITPQNFHNIFKPTKEITA